MIEKVNGPYKLRLNNIKDSGKYSFLFLTKKIKG
jgi:hypothetical protein